METRRKHEDLIDAFQRGEDVSIDDLPEPTRDRLRAERATCDAARAAFDARQVETSAARERDLEVAFLRNGGTPADWSREKASILATDRAARARDGATASMSLVDHRSFLN